MKRTRPPKRNKPAGKPPLHGTSYRRAFDKIAEGVCRTTGGSTKTLAECFSMDEIQVKKWRDLHPSFGRAVQRGRDYYDTEGIERALALRAKGFQYDEKEYGFKTIYNEDGTPIKQIKMKKKVTTKFLPGSVDAQKYWLRMRNPTRWEPPKQDLPKEELSDVNEQILKALANKLPD